MLVYQLRVYSEVAVFREDWQRRSSLQSSGSEAVQSEQSRVAAE
jgi:hypothetical protein